MNQVNTVMTPEYIAELQERNAQRVQESIKRLGTKYLMHPANQIKARRTHVEVPTWLLASMVRNQKKPRVSATADVSKSANNILQFIENT